MMFIVALIITFTIKGSLAKNDKAEIYHNVKDGCQLINCTNGTYCGIRSGTAKLGTLPFEQFLYPKCVTSQAELYENTDPDGNAHIETNGPGCNMVQCSEGYQCQVRISTSKLGDLPYAQSINGFPQCVAPNGTYQSTNSIIINGNGCDQITCPSGKQCLVAVGIAKYGKLEWSQFFWPFCN